MPKMIKIQGAVNLCWISARCWEKNSFMGHFGAFLLNSHCFAMKIFDRKCNFTSPGKNWVKLKGQSIPAKPLLNPCLLPLHVRCSDAPSSAHWLKKASGIVGGNFPYWPKIASAKFQHISLQGIQHSAWFFSSLGIRQYWEVKEQSNEKAFQYLLWIGASIADVYQIKHARHRIE